ncbi:MAG: DUF3568 family protein [Methylophilaceae bacterium]
MYKIIRVAVLCIAVGVLSGCIAAATTVAGMGGSAAINHTINGVSYRTFTAPSHKVKKATFIALKRMKIKVVSKGKKKNEDVYLISAKAIKRNIEVEIESISANATRIRVQAKKSTFSYDSATADEIVMQTKRQLG